LRKDSVSLQLYLDLGRGGGGRGGGEVSTRVFFFSWQKNSRRRGQATLNNVLRKQKGKPRDFGGDTPFRVFSVERGAARQTTFYSYLTGHVSGGKKLVFVGGFTGRAKKISLSSPYLRFIPAHKPSFVSGYLFWIRPRRVEKGGGVGIRPPYHKKFKNASQTAV